MNLTVKYPKAAIKRIKKQIVNKQFTTSAHNFREIRSTLNLAGINQPKA